MAVAGVAIIGLLFQYFAVISGIKERLTEIETKVELFWKALEGRVVDMLKSPNLPYQDVLLEKLRAGGLSEEEAEDLKEILLKEMLSKEEDAGKQLAYVLIIGRLDGIIFELRKGHKKWMSAKLRPIAQKIMKAIAKR